MTAQKFVVWFHEVDKGDGNLVGGKGANLGEMTQAKLPVPPGFIVTSHAYYTFIAESNLKPKIQKLLENIDYEDTKKLQKAAADVQKIIVKAPVPKEVSSKVMKYYLELSSQETAHSSKQKGAVETLDKQSKAHEVPVAVRSSATAEDLPEASFAGQQATFLNIKGEANVMEAVKEAWASLFTARAIFYRHDHGFDHFKVGIAIPVQKMVSSRVSGVMFTVDPVSNNKKHMVIESIYGLGELIVQGAVTPDQYLLEKSSVKILQKTYNKQSIYLPGIGQKEEPLPTKFRDKPKLTDKQVQELAKIGKKIEKHYYFPQDIEWALDGDDFYIVQTRPITTLDKKIESEEKQIRKKLKKLKLIAEGSGASPGVASGKVTIIKKASQINKIHEGDVLVAEQTNPDFVPAMKKASAIVTQKGGRTSHAAIVSRELGLPAVVGAADVLTKLKERMEITVDGSEGEIRKGVIEGIEKLQHRPNSAVESAHIKTATKVYTNLAEVDLAESVSKMNVDGIGLLRAEFMLADIGVHPRYILEKKKSKDYIKDLAERIAQFCEAFGPQRPVVYRTTDFKTNEYRNLRHGQKYERLEENPMIGFRGASRYVADEDVFEMELKSINYVRNKLGHKNLHVMIPFVRTPEELKKTKRIMASQKLIRSANFKLWMMVEIPVNVISLEDFIDVGIDGVSIGSNDLTQLILGVDRDNGTLSESFNEMNPAVQWAIEKTVKTCAKHKISCSICGQAASDYPELVAKLVEWGATSVSVNPDVVNSVRQTVYKAEQDLVTKKKS